MRIRNFVINLFVLQTISIFLTINGEIKHINNSSNSFVFSSDFLFGVSTSAYQIEGAYLAEGKGLNNWDEFTHQNPDKIADGRNGDVATDHYNRYLEDIDLMASLGINSYRFSISWARILPKGRFGGINFAGIDHYNNVIDALLNKGIQPFVTLAHFDYPQEMEDRYKTWLSLESQKDFEYYSDICFKYFGDRVKHWVTFNEPNFYSILGYMVGLFPPAHCSVQSPTCKLSSPETDPFIAAHNMILAHAKAVDLYRTKYQKKQGGSIGIVCHAVWYEPYSNSVSDQLAAKRALSFFFHWFLDPLFFGKYPKEMQVILGPILPRFTRSEKHIMKKALDFIGINHYSSSYVKDCFASTSKECHEASKSDGYLVRSRQRNGVSIGNATDLTWINVHPDGMKNIVNHVKDRYRNIPTFITENGFGDNNPNLTVQELLQDSKRVDYLAAYLDSLKESIREGADVRGYFVWSLMDNFEWLYGYNARFGLFHLDNKTLKRTPKRSAAWYKDFITKHAAEV